MPIASRGRRAPGAHANYAPMTRYSSTGLGGPAGFHPLYEWATVHPETNWPHGDDLALSLRRDSQRPQSQYRIGVSLWTSDPTECRPSLRITTPSKRRQEIALQNSRRF